MWRERNQHVYLLMNEGFMAIVMSLRYKKTLSCHSYRCCSARVKYNCIIICMDCYVCRSVHKHNLHFEWAQVQYVSDRLTDCRSKACQFPELYNFGMSNIMLWGGMKIQTNQPLHEQISDPGFGHTKIWETEPPIWDTKQCWSGYNSRAYPLLVHL